MAEVVDSIIVELIARADKYVSDMERAAAAARGNTAALKELQAADAMSETSAGRRASARAKAAVAEDEASGATARARKKAADDSAAADEAGAARAGRASRARTAEEVRAIEEVKTAAHAKRLAAEVDAAAEARAVVASEREKAAAAKASAAERVAADREAARAGVAGAEAGALGARLDASSAKRVIVERSPAPAAGGAIGGRAGSRADVAAQTAVMARTTVPGGAAAAGEVEAEREINHLLADQASLQARLATAPAENVAAMRDQVTELRLISQYKRAGLTDDEALLRTEADLAAIEASRTKQMAEQTAVLEKQMRAQQGKIADKINLFAPALLGGITAHELSAMNDEYTRFSDSLKVAGVSALEFSGVQDHLLKTSLRIGTDIGSLADTYRSMALAAHNLGASQDQMLKITDAVANSLRITGASGTAARGAILQLGHAFETGRVTAREFNGLTLNAYPILQAAAAGSDKFGGSVAKLRAALIAGDLSSKELFDDILRGSGILESRANKAALTTAQGFNALRSALVVYIGSSDQAIGVSAALGNGLQLVATHLDELIPAIAAIGTALTIGYATRAVKAAVETKNLGAALLGAFGGPIGLAITAVTLAIGSFMPRLPVTMP